MGMEIPSVIQDSNANMPDVLPMVETSSQANDFLFSNEDCSVLHEVESEKMESMNYMTNLCLESTQMMTEHNISSSVDLSHTLSEEDFNFETGTNFSSIFPADFESLKWNEAPALEPQLLITEQPQLTHVSSVIAEENACGETKSSEPNSPTLTVDNNAIGQKNSGKITAEIKYLEMRRKNNIASQRSRKVRKLKNRETSEQVQILEKENKELLMQVEKLEKQRDVLQNYLLNVMTKRS